MGQALEKGWGVPVDMVAACVLYADAARKGHDGAQRRLADFYWRGWGGLPMDHALAAVWYERAAAEGEPAALFMLGRMYMDGDSVPRDLTRALELLLQSAKLWGARYRVVRCSDDE